MPKRNPNVKACPHAAAWLQQHPDAARNLRRIVRFMASCYVGDSQGFINRNAEMVEYRFAPVEEESLFWAAHIYARQKHAVVRFYLYKRFRKSLLRSKILKSAKGEDLHAIDIPVASTATLDELQSFIQKTATTSAASASNGKHASIVKALEKAEQLIDGMTCFLSLP